MKIKFRYIMLFLALAVAGCAAYFSVWGLSQLFAGASTAVIIMASILEIGKIVTTTALHTYWGKLAKGLRTYLTISVVVLMLITSAGIYGFLSNAYQKTANKLEIHEGELGVLEAKKTVFEKSVVDNQKIIDSKTKRLDQLSNLRTSQEARLDGSNSNRARNSVRSDIQNANSEIQKLTADIDGLNVKNGVLADSISAYNVKALELKSGSDIAGEVGPLKYIASLTGVPMASVVNYMILLLIFVFDPLAVALVLITNKVFLLETGHSVEEETNVVEEDVDEGVNEGVNEENEGVNEENEGVNEVIADNSSPIFENIAEPVDEVVVRRKKEPVIPKGKIELEDIKEIKESNRGFSVNIPKSKNTVERIGTNKLIKDGDNNKVYFKRDNGGN
jgi:flagellar biosynthesis/type III secretory pathway chaperone